MRATKPIDLVVVGAGPAGSLLALLAARAGLQVRLLERARFPRPKPCGGVLSPRAVQLLARAGLAQQVLAAGAVPIRRIHVVGQDGARAELPYGEGLALERQHLDTCLLGAAAAAGARIDTGVQVEVDLSAPGGGGRLGLREDGCSRSEIRASWIVGAGGRRCPVRRALGRAQRQRALVHERTAVAVAAVLEGVCAAEETCEMHVLGTGYCGVAAAGNGRTSIGHVLPAAVWRRLGHRPGGVLAAALGSSRSLAAGAGKLRLVAGPWASGSLTDAPPPRVPAGVALAGDALARLEPITGEGMAEAFESAFRIVDFLRRSPDPHGASALHREAVRAVWRVRRRSALAAALSRAPRAARTTLALLGRLPPLATWVGRQVGGLPQQQRADSPPNSRLGEGLQA